MNPRNIAVVGGGLTGFTSAIALGKAGHQVTLFAQSAEFPDPRTTAILASTAKFFEGLGLWQQLQLICHPLKTMRIVDGTKRLIRSPQVDFHANEIELEAFGYNFRNSKLLEILTAELAKLSDVKWVNGIAEINSSCDQEVELVCDDIRVKADIIVGADGRNSPTRQAFEIKTRDWNYEQSALVVDFEHALPTNSTSTEFHTEHGPFTIVPQTQTRAGLVWMSRPAEIEMLIEKTSDELALLIEQKMQSFLGKIRLVSKPKSFPISGMVAQQFGKNNTVLVGESAHVFPPIGAQGFNLGVRDIQTLIELLQTQINTADFAQLYHQRRSADIHSRTQGVDMLNRTLLSDFLPIQLLRGIGLYSLDKIKPLRVLAMQQGIAPEIMKV